MRKTVSLLASAALLALSGAAHAHSCPAEMKAIDEKVKSAKLKDADAKKVADLRKKGEEEHKAGKHADSMKTLGEAKKILGI